MTMASDAAIRVATKVKSDAFATVPKGEPAEAKTFTITLPVTWPVRRGDGDEKKVLTFKINGDHYAHVQELLENLKKDKQVELIVAADLTIESVRVNRIDYECDTEGTARPGGAGGAPAPARSCRGIARCPTVCCWGFSRLRSRPR